MVTNGQAQYLRDLGIDERASIDDLPPGEASAWIEELQGYRAQAGISKGRPVTPEHLRRVGGREDALILPPSRSAAGARAAPRPEPEPARAVSRVRVGPVADESWWKLELQATVALREGKTISVVISGSEHRRAALSLEAATELGARVRSALEEQVEKVRSGA